MQITFTWGYSLEMINLGLGYNLEFSGPDADIVDIHSFRVSGEAM
jgi:hypothetical protein